MKVNKTFSKMNESDSIGERAET